MSQITQYVEERHEFGSDRPAPSGNAMQVIYDGETPYAVDFLCPCGCGDSIYLPVCVGTKEKYKWGFSPGPHLTPSVRRLNACKSHFNVEANGVVKMHAS